MTTCTPSRPLSHLESLPTEILTEIFLWWPNFSLPRASLHLGRALATDSVFEKLCQRAFGRDDRVAWPDAFYLSPMLLCRHCQLDREEGDDDAFFIEGEMSWDKMDEWAIDELYDDIPDQELDAWFPEEYREAGCQEEGEGFEDTDEEVDEQDEVVGVDDVMEENERRSEMRFQIWRKNLAREMGVKRYLQREIMKSKWFELKHVRAVEENCQTCLGSNVEVFQKDVCREAGFVPHDLGTMVQYFKQFHHRRHVFHGVGLPTRLLRKSFQGRQDDKELIAKLLGWTNDMNNWSVRCCSQNRHEVLEAAEQGMKDAIRKKRLGDIELFGQKAIVKPAIGVEVNMEMIRIALTENQPGPKNDQVVLALLELHELRDIEPWWKDPAWLPCFNAAKRLRRDATTKERGQWLVYHLTAEKAPEEEHDEPGARYVGQIRQRSGTQDPLMDLKRMASDIDNEYGVEKIWGFLTRRRQRQLDGCCDVDDTMLYRMLKMSHLLDRSGNNPAAGDDREEFFSMYDATVADMVRCFERRARSDA